LLGRSVRDLRRRVGEEVRRLRVDANLSQRALAAAARIDHGYLSQIEAGSREPSLGVLVALGDVLGADLQVRLYPTTGPRIHDRIQAAMIEALFAALHPGWKRIPEVAVHRPARGFIDAVLVLSSEGLFVATEGQSEIRRLEQQIRWGRDKADSLPSSDVWRMASGIVLRPTISQLLLLRSTRATRLLARTFRSTLEAAYPARAADIHRALTEPGAPWPGSGILWVNVDGSGARLLDGPPRGVSFGS
jgi:transcriptional regulator with XRE-family HTH domain